MALQFDMSKNNWQQDLMLQNEDNPYFALGEKLGDAGAVVGQKLFPEGGKNLLTKALGIPGAIGAAGLAMKKGSKGLQQKIKGARQNISTRIKNTGRKVKQAADTAVDLFIGDKDMLDQFEGSQDSTLIKALKRGKLNKANKLAKKERDAVSFTPSPEMSDKYVGEFPIEKEFGEVGNPQYNELPANQLQDLGNFEAPIAKPKAPDYIIQEEIDKKTGRDRFKQMIQKPRLYSPNEAAAREALLNQNFGPLQSLMMQQQNNTPKTMRTDGRMDMRVTNPY